MIPPANRVANIAPYACQYDCTTVDAEGRAEGPGACNMTSLWMGLAYLKRAPKSPDDLLHYCDANHLDRHTLETIAAVARHYGAKDNASYGHTIEEIKEFLAQGHVVVVQGEFTPSGHVILVCGYDEVKGLWLCNDPAGDWNAPNHYREPGWRSGDRVCYQSAWFRSKAAPDGKVWAHLLSL